MNDREPSKKKKAVALNYKTGQDQAPYVSAKADGKMAEQLIEKAKSLNIPIQEDPDLVSMLSRLDLNEMIPVELYEAVAEIFAYIRKIDEKKGGNAH
ncbi:EscU/YscU/HrcU family type III secretion system export apparatus switch protein [Sporolactobacillus sp. Y61]|jgi:flagellar biosynthesis protein|uniref:EscU/YscU/HrcU family type III secretion system export apparatus switch protein n=1 Tax=Sporolactobacillus sp. Y61 TaxID=3160863 RepID=A0AAU8ICS2_9BACL|nr:EscU/YscU/HrcU family type III secretion system export apparatus switch protein [Sporolactobacillus sp. THM19-2]RYL92936.1 hypothetical protein EWH91_06485 [Sporolactobacillus sp. THM19-2]